MALGLIEDVVDTVIEIGAVRVLEGYTEELLETKSEGLALELPVALRDVRPDTEPVIVAVIVGEILADLEPLPVTEL